jgi:hypothetical protein
LPQRGAATLDAGGVFIQETIAAGVTAFFEKCKVKKLSSGIIFGLTDADGNIGGAKDFLKTDGTGTYAGVILL